MKGVAKRLRQEDPKKWTQEALGAVFGVGQNTVSDWFMRNIDGDTTHTAQPKPDARVKLNAAAQDEIIERLDDGESRMSGMKLGPGSRAHSRLRIEQRREIFAALVALQDQGADVAESFRAIAAQHQVTERGVRKIQDEGIERDWPPLDDLGGYEVLGHREAARRVGTISFVSEALPAQELGESSIRRSTSPSGRGCTAPRTSTGRGRPSRRAGRFASARGRSTRTRRSTRWRRRWRRLAVSDAS
jgi:hypothetical protein